MGRKSSCKLCICDILKNKEEWSLSTEASVVVCLYVASSFSSSLSTLHNTLREDVLTSVSFDPSNLGQSSVVYDIELRRNMKRSRDDDDSGGDDRRTPRSFARETNLNSLPGFVKG